MRDREKLVQRPEKGREGERERERERKREGEIKVMHDNMCDYA